MPKFQFCIFFKRCCTGLPSFLTEISPWDISMTKLSLAQENVSCNAKVACIIWRRWEWANQFAAYWKLFFPRAGHLSNLIMLCMQSASLEHSILIIFCDCYIQRHRPPLVSGQVPRLSKIDEVYYYSMQESKKSCNSHSGLPLGSCILSSLWLCAEYNYNPLFFSLYFFSLLGKMQFGWI